MKKQVLLIILFYHVVTCFSQSSNESFYVFKKDWTPAKDMESATYFMHEVVENDTTYVCRFYNKTGPMVKLETYQDSSLKIPHGTWAWYNTNGDIDSVGEFSMGKKDKYWRYGINANGGMRISEEYQSGSLIKKINYITKKIMSNGTESDLNDSSLVVSLPYPSKMPNLSMTDDRPSEFKNGGVSGWVQYLRDNLKTPNRFTLISGPRTSATVLVEFLVNQDGQVVNVLIDHSREWSVDMAALKIIKNSPPWFPARQGGRFVMYRHRQKLTFQVND